MGGPSSLAGQPEKGSKQLARMMSCSGQLEIFYGSFRFFADYRPTADTPGRPFRPLAAWQPGEMPDRTNSCPARQHVGMQPLRSMERIARIGKPWCSSGCRGMLLSLSRGHACLHAQQHAAGRTDHASVCRDTQDPQGRHLMWLQGLQIKLWAVCQTVQYARLLWGSQQVSGQRCSSPQRASQRLSWHTQGQREAHQLAVHGELQVRPCQGFLCS